MEPAKKNKIKEYNIVKCLHFIDVTNNKITSHSTVQQYIYMKELRFNPDAIWCSKLECQLGKESLQN